MRKGRKVMEKPAVGWQGNILYYWTLIIRAIYMMRLKENKVAGVWILQDLW